MKPVNVTPLTRRNPGSNLLDNVATHHTIIKRHHRFSQQTFRAVIKCPAKINLRPAPRLPMRNHIQTRKVPHKRNARVCNNPARHHPLVIPHIGRRNAFHKPKRSRSGATPAPKPHVCKQSRHRLGLHCKPAVSRVPHKHKKSTPVLKPRVASIPTRHKITRSRHTIVPPHIPYLVPRPGVQNRMPNTLKRIKNIRPGCGRHCTGRV